MTKLSFPGHFRVILVIVRPGRHANPGHRGRAADSRFPRAGLGGRGFLGPRGSEWARGLGTNAPWPARSRHPRPAPAGPRRPERPARDPASPAGATRRDRVGPLRPADEAARIRTRRKRLSREAVLVRRARRANPRAAPARAK